MSTQVSPGYPNWMKKQARMPTLAETPAGVADLVDGRLLVHRVEHTLAATLGAEPHLVAPGTGERIDRLVGHEVAA